MVDSLEDVITLRNTMKNCIPPLIPVLGKNTPVPSIIIDFSSIIFGNNNNNNNIRYLRP